MRDCDMSPAGTSDSHAVEMILLLQRTGKKTLTIARHESLTTLTHSRHVSGRHNWMKRHREACFRLVSLLAYRTSYSAHVRLRYTWEHHPPHHHRHLHYLPFFSHRFLFLCAVKVEEEELAERGKGAEASWRRYGP